MALVPGDHGSTFGGNALTTAAAYAGTKFLIDNDILANVKAMERHLVSKLDELRARFSFISEVRCKGLLAAVEFDSDISGQVLTNANEAGVLLNGVKPNAGFNDVPGGIEVRLANLQMNTLLALGL